MDKSDIISIIITIVEVIALWRMEFAYIAHLQHKQKQLDRKNKLIKERDIFIKSLYTNEA